MLTAEYLSGLEPLRCQSVDSVIASSCSTVAVVNVLVSENSMSLNKVDSYVTLSLGTKPSHLFFYSFFYSAHATFLIVITHLLVSGACFWHQSTGTRNWPVCHTFWC